LNRKHGWFLLL
jgi:hypothetical protein